MRFVRGSTRRPGLPAGVSARRAGAGEHERPGCICRLAEAMKLPNAERAIVPDRKITHYLLSATHRDGRHKTEFFRSFGFALEAWQELAVALSNHAHSNEVVKIVPTPFGRTFVIKSALPAPDGRAPQVRAIWFIANGEEIATLAT